MSKNLIITLSTILVLIIVGLFGVAYFIGRSTSQSTGEVLRDFLPFGEGGGASRSVDVEPFEDRDDVFGFNDEEGALITPSKLMQLTTFPVAGATSFSNEEGVVILHYVNQASGNIYSINLDSNRRTRLTNSTILGIKKVFWNKDGTSLLVQYLDENNVVKSFLGEITPKESEVLAKLDGKFIDDDILAVVVSPQKTKFFYLTEFGVSIIGTKMDFDGSSKQQIFTHPLKEWLVQWLGSGKLSLTTRPSQGSFGYSFLLSESTGRLESVLGELRGLLTNTSPDTNNVLVSDVSGGTLRTRLYKRQNKEFSAFPLTTLPEKCVWSEGNETIIYCAAPEQLPEGEYPDSWYKGLISLTDNLWKIDTFSGAVSFLVSPRDFAGEELDIIDLFLSDDEEYLFFTNKKDGALWVLILEN